MKKITVLLLLAALLMTAGCGAKQPAETPATPSPDVSVPETEAPVATPEATPEPTPEPVPDCVDAVVQVDRSPAILTLLKRGDQVDVVGEYDDEHYVIKTELGYGLMEKQLLRISGEAPYASWTGYAYGGAGFYDNYQLRGTPAATLTLNTECEVLDELDDCYVVKVGEDIGFVAKVQISKNYIVYTGGGGGAGTGADGGDISLSFGGIQRLSYVAQSGDVTGTATVLADGAPVVLGYLDRDEVIPVVAEEGFAPEWDGYCTLYLDGLYAYVPAEFVLQDGDEAYEVWSGYAVYGARVYDNYLLRDAGKTVNLNTLVAVLWDCGDFYVVSVNDEICYMATSAVSKTLIATGGGGGGGGDTDWTPPAL